MIGKSMFIFVAFCALGQSAFAASACHFEADKVCVETKSDAIEINCEEGTVVEVCKSEERFGSCVFSASGEEVYARFYNGYASDAKSDCDQVEGTYSDGK